MTSQEKFEFYKNFGAEIRKRRLGMGMTLEAFGNLVFKTRATIHGIENGRQHVYIHDYLEMQAILKLPDLPTIAASENKKTKISKEIIEKLFNVKIV
jgi:transcriptional regulator with XRE-family HTH domain